MHPVIHLALKKYVETRYGIREWLHVLDVAGVSTALPYVRLGEYPDEELFAIVEALAKERGVPLEVVWEGFGAAAAGDLITMYPRLIRREWSALDVICNAEETIHRVVRRRHAGTRPPVLVCERLSPMEVRVTYTSRRRLCAFARGIMRGVAAHYAQVITITHPSCTWRGDAACVFLLTLQQARPVEPSE